MRKVFINFVSAMLIAFLVLMQFGCSTLGGARQPFSVTVNEPDAQIYINGEFIGNGNVRTEVPRNRSLSVMAKKEGYYTVTRDIGTQISMWGILDIIGGVILIVPFIGLAFPGARELNQDNVSLVLNKEAK